MKAFICVLLIEKPHIYHVLNLVNLLDLRATAIYQI